MEEQGGAQHYVTVGQGFYVVVGQPAVAGLCRLERAHHMGMRYTNGDYYSSLCAWICEMGRDRETVCPTPAPLMLLLVLPATVPN